MTLTLIIGNNTNDLLSCHLNTFVSPIVNHDTRPSSIPLDYRDMIDDVGDKPDLLYFSVNVPAYGRHYYVDVTTKRSCGSDIKESYVESELLKHFQNIVLANPLQQEKKIKTCMLIGTLYPLDIYCTIRIWLFLLHLSETNKENPPAMTDKKFSYHILLLKFWFDQPRYQDIKPRIVQQSIVKEMGKGVVSGISKQIFISSFYKLPDGPLPTDYYFDQKRHCSRICSSKQCLSLDIMKRSYSNEAQSHNY